MKSFSEEIESTDNIMIVDALNLAFRYKHAKTRHFKDSYLGTVQSLAASYNADKVIITADGRGGSRYRLGILPEYKGNRKAKYAKQTEKEAAEFANFMEDYNDTLELLKEHFIVLQYEGVEADDLAAYLVEILDKNIWLISTDRDWDLLIDDKTSRFSYITRKEVTKDNWSEHYEVDRGEYISFKCLCGDSGDNVPGVPGIGPKRAVGLIEQYGSAFDIAASLPISGKYKYIQALNEFGAANIYKNYELMDLETYSSDAIGVDNCTEIREQVYSVCAD